MSRYAVNKPALPPQEGFRVPGPVPALTPDAALADVDLTDEEHRAFVAL